MPPAGPYTLVPPPHLRPPLLGLLQAAEVVEHASGLVEDETPSNGGDHWLAGIKWLPASTRPTVALDPCNATPNLSTTPSRTNSALGVYTPFLVSLEDICSAFGFEQSNYVARAEEALRAKEWAAVEAEFELAALTSSVNYRLADSTASTYTTIPSTGLVNLSPGDALAALDESIANSRVGQGMIHATAFVVAKWLALPRAVTVEAAPLTAGSTSGGFEMYSPNGNIIVAGSGYTGNDPATGNPVASHTSQYAYATGLVVVHRDADITVVPGPDDFAAATDRANNTVAFRAFRAYAIEWSRSLHAAVKISTPYTAVP